MLLSKLLENVEIEQMKNYYDCEINEVVTNSLNAKDNTMFCCIVGEKVDAHNYTKDAIENGCKVFLVERVLQISDNSVIQIKVASVRNINNFYT